MPKTKKKGSRILKTFIIIGIIVILAVIVSFKVYSAKKCSKSNDLERRTEIGTIVSSIYQYQSSPNANDALPQCLFGKPPVLTTIPECDGSGTGSFDGAVELGTNTNTGTYDCSNILVPFYLRKIPTDPGNSYNTKSTGYYICQDKTKAVPRVYVIAVGAEAPSSDDKCQIPGTTTPAMCVSG